MPRQHIRLKRLKITISPWLLRSHVTVPVNSAQAMVFISVWLTLAVNKYFAGSQCVHAWQIENLAETNFVEIFGRAKQILSVQCIRTHIHWWLFCVIAVTSWPAKDTRTLSNSVNTRWAWRGHLDRISISYICLYSCCVKIKQYPPPRRATRCLSSWLKSRWSSD